MQLTNVCVVEKGADWAQWQLLARGLRQGVVIFVQQTDERSTDFRKRIARRLARLRTKDPRITVLLDDSERARANHRRRDLLLTDLAAITTDALHVFPQPMPKLAQRGTIGQRGTVASA